MWGDDLILEHRRLMDHSQAVALTYLEVMSLSKEAVDASCDQFPLARRTIDKAALRIRMQRALLLFFCRSRGTKPRSFIPEDNARGYFFVGPQMTTDEKVSALHDAFKPTSLRPTPALVGSASTAAPPSAAEPRLAALSAPSTEVDARLEQLIAVVSGMSAVATTTDERVTKLGAAFESLASTLATRRGPLGRAPSSLSAHPLESSRGDDGVAPRSGNTKSRPPLPPRRAATAANCTAANGAQGGSEPGPSRRRRPDLDA